MLIMINIGSNMVRNDYSRPTERNESDSTKGHYQKNLRDIRQAIGDGYSKKSIYELLKEEGAINCSYQYFVQVLNKTISETLQRKEQEKRLMKKIHVAKAKLGFDRSSPD